MSITETSALRDPLARVPPSRRWSFLADFAELIRERGHGVAPTAIAAGAIAALPWSLSMAPAIVAVWVLSGPLLGGVGEALGQAGASTAFSERGRVDSTGGRALGFGVVAIAIGALLGGPVLFTVLGALIVRGWPLTSRLISGVPRGKVVHNWFLPGMLAWLAMDGPRAVPTVDRVAIGPLHEIALWSAINSLFPLCLIGLGAVIVLLHATEAPAMRQVVAGIGVALLALVVTDRSIAAMLIALGAVAVWPLHMTRTTAARSSAGRVTTLVARAALLVAAAAA